MIYGGVIKADKATEERKQTVQKTHRSVKASSRQMYRSKTHRSMSACRSKNAAFDECAPFKKAKLLQCRF